MQIDINPKLPMFEKSATRKFCLNKPALREFGNADYNDM